MASAVNAYLAACERRGERPRENVAAALGEQGAIFRLGATALVRERPHRSCADPAPACRFCARLEPASAPRPL